MRWVTSVVVFACVACVACTGEPLGERVIVVSLGYQDRTNVGPETARGVATIDTVSGAVLIDVMGLAPLSERDRYEAWLAGGGEDPETLGRFSVDSFGDAAISATLIGLPESTFTRVELTVEPEPDPSPDPDVRISIGGPIE